MTTSSRFCALFCKRFVDSHACKTTGNRANAPAAPESYTLAPSSG